VRLVAVAFLAAFGAVAQGAAETSGTANVQAAGVRKLVANDADVTFAITTVESALRQYRALPDAKKAKIDAQVARVAGATDVATVAATLRTTAAAAGVETLKTPENRRLVKTFLDAEPKWCGAVKAARVTRQAMAKMGMSGELSLDDMVRLLPEPTPQSPNRSTAR